MTKNQLEKKLIDKYGLGGMTESEIYAEFRIRKDGTPKREIEYYMVGKRKRYCPLAVAEWYTQKRVPGWLLED
jgi:hypothetical protein